MKREAIIHFTFWVAFFLLISLFRGWFSLAYLPLWFGGIVGTILPDVDHLIYVYFLRPHELSSQRVNSMVSKHELVKSLQYLAETRSERTHLIFHTGYFQAIFFALAFLVITSSGSIFGRGLVLGFALHLIIDQVVDIMETGKLENWLRQLPIELEEEQQRWYLGLMLLIFLVFAFIL
jgi:hypothetical protein